MTNVTGAADVDRRTAIVIWDSAQTVDEVRDRYSIHMEVVGWLRAAPMHRISAPALARELEARWNDARELADRQRSLPTAWDLSPGVEVGWDWLADLVGVEGLGLSFHWPGDGCTSDRCGA